VIFEAEMQLHQLLRGHKALAREWVSEAVRCRVVAPPSAHCALLEMALTARCEERGQIMLALGARGKWLAAQNPRWQGLIEETTSLDRWAGAGLQDRAAALRELRGDDPGAALDLLRDVWVAEPARERAALLAALGSGLGAGDQDFLESALADKSVEVRRAAIGMLAQLPESAIARQAVSIAFACVNVSKSFLGTKVHIELAPEEPTPFDVLDESVPNVGARAAKLARIIGCVPPQAWLSDTGMFMRDLFHTVHRKEFADVVRGGWEIAAMRFRDVEAADSIFSYWAESPSNVLPPILPLVSKRRLDEVRLSMIRSKSSQAPLLLATPQPWDEATSRAFLQYYLSHNAGHLSQIDAPEAARRIAQETIEGALQSIPPEMEQQFRSWHEILPLRREMIQTIRRKANP
jgi:hypothetical protein